MKIKIETFQPVTITLETQGEVDLLASVLARFDGQNDMLYNLFCALDRPGRKYKAVTGEVKVEQV